MLEFGAGISGMIQPAFLSTHIFIAYIAVFLSSRGQKLIKVDCRLEQILLRYMGGASVNLAVRPTNAQHVLKNCNCYFLL